EALATDPVDRSKVYAATVKSLLRSDDGAATWSPISEGMSGHRTVLAFEPGLRGNLYAGTNWGGVLRSPDGGRSWLPTGPGIAESFVQSLVVDPGARSTVYAGGRSVWKS